MVYCIVLMVKFAAKTSHHSQGLHCLYHVLPYMYFIDFGLGLLPEAQVLPSGAWSQRQTCFLRVHVE